MQFTHLNNCLEERVFQLFVLGQQVIESCELSIFEALYHLVFVGSECCCVVFVICFANLIKFSLSAEGLVMGVLESAKSLIIFIVPLIVPLIVLEEFNVFSCISESVG
jgi:hypothetical protein